MQGTYFSSPNRAPTRSECLRNFWMQFETHVSCGSQIIERTQPNQNQSSRQYGCQQTGKEEMREKERERGWERTSLVLRALEVKSLQHDSKHRSTRPVYSLRKSFICFCSMMRVIACCSDDERPETVSLHEGDDMDAEIDTRQEVSNVSL